MTKLQKPRFKSLSTISEVGGIPILRTLWDRFDFSLLLSQAGIFKIRGVSTWILAFLYMVGLVAGCSSVNELASLYTKDGLLQRMFGKVKITQPTLSRFLTGFSQWSAFNSKRTQRLQEDTETALADGDIIALDDTHAPHPYAEKIPFLYWLFDSSRKVHIWAMNLVVLHAVRKNGVEYPWSFAIWKKPQDESSDNQKQSKLDLAWRMLCTLRAQVSCRLWVVMDRWYFCKDFLRKCESKSFDWVTKAKRNTALFRLVIEPGTGRKRFVPIRPIHLIREAYPLLKAQGTGVVSIVCQDIYMKMPIPYVTRKGKQSTKMKHVPIAAVVGLRLKKDNEEQEVLIQSDDPDKPAQYKGAYLIISNRYDAPQEALGAWLQRWNIEILFRTAKQELGMLNCHSTDENHINAHLTLLFTAETLLRYLVWQQRKTAGKESCTHGQVVRKLLCIRCRIPRNVGSDKQHSITLDIDTEAKGFARLIDKFWPSILEMGWFCPSSCANNHYLASTA